MNKRQPSPALLEVLSDYVAVRQLDDGRWIGVQRLMYHFTLHVAIDEVGYGDRWCHGSLAMALDDLESFDGISEPKWWHKHPATGRYRDLASGVVWTAADPTPDVVKGVDWPYNFEPELTPVPAPSP